VFCISKEINTKYPYFEKTQIGFEVDFLLIKYKEKKKKEKRVGVRPLIVEESGGRPVTLFWLKRSLSQLLSS
jgi:hypothetical protein